MLKHTTKSINSSSEFFFNAVFFIIDKYSFTKMEDKHYFQIADYVFIIKMMAWIKNL